MPSLFATGEMEPSALSPSNAACALPQPLTRMCRCGVCQYNTREQMQGVLTYLKRVLPRETLVAVSAWERLDSKMYPLVPLQVVIAVETLRTLVTFERSVVCRAWLRLLWMTVDVMNLCCMPAVEALHHVGRHATDQSKLTVGIADVRENWTRHRVRERPLLIVRGRRALRGQ